MNSPFRFLIAFLGLLPAAAASADTVELVGGSRLEGVVLSGPAEGERAPVRLLLPHGDEVLLAAADVKGVLADASAPAPGQHLRFVEAGATPGGLDTAITSFVHPDGGARIDLVAVVHIADHAYFRAVQRVLEGAGAVLFEGVIPAGKTPSELLRERSDEENPVRGLQRKMAAWFDLGFQLEEIEYGRPHFVHADLTAEEVFGKGASPDGADGKPGEPGEEGKGDPGGAAATPGGVQGLLRMVEQMGPMLEAMLANPSVRAGLKAQFARVLGSADVSAMMGTMVPELAEVLLHRRNAVLVERIREWGPKTEGSVAVLYGGAHMKDVERVLVEELGYRRAGGRWLRAWAIEGKSAPK
jgi:hypothetical protein